jgi:hypothetical protein
MALEQDFLARLQAGEHLPLDELDFAAMEDRVTHELLPFAPEYTTGQRQSAELNWQYRPRLAREFRGRDFHGLLLQPHVWLEPEIGDQLINRATRFTRIDVADAIKLHNVVALTLTADTRSSAGGGGSLTRQLLYFRAKEGGKNYREENYWYRYLGHNTTPNANEAGSRRRRAG